MSYFRKTASIVFLNHAALSGIFHNGADLCEYKCDKRCSKDSKPSRELGIVYVEYANPYRTVKLT